MALGIVKIQPDNARFGVAVNWGGIMLGTIVALAVGLLFVTLGNAIGLRAYELFHGIVKPSLRIISGVYAFLTLTAAFYLGGFSASRACALSDRGTALFHGLAVWALTGVFLALVGVLRSPLFQRIIRGTSSGTTHWLVFLVAVFGVFWAVKGARRGIVQSDRIGEQRERAERIA